MILVRTGKGESQREAAANLRPRPAVVADLVAAARQILTERLLLPLAQRVGGEQSRLRASFCASQFVGLAMARYVVGVEPLASMPGEQVVKALTPVFEHYLYGDWVDPDPADDQTASGSPLKC